MSDDPRLDPRHPYHYLLTHQDECLPKLIRDRMDERIIADGFEPRLSNVDPFKIVAALWEKLDEEKAEVIAAAKLHSREGHDALVEELADVVAIIRSLAYRYACDWAEVLDAEAVKAHERGRFLRGLQLLGLELAQQPDGDGS